MVEVNDYFWNPAFFWFYADEEMWNDDYYVAWYGPVYGQYPRFHERFRRPRVFYPTLAFAELTTGVSTWEAQRQLVFRDAMSQLTVLLEVNLSSELGTQVVLDQGSIEVDHYQLLQGAVVIDGIASVNGQGYAFKSFLDLNNPNNSSVVVPALAEQPGMSDINAVNALNARIIQSGGVLEDATDQ